LFCFLNPSLTSHINKMPHQPRRKTLSPSQATTFLSAANLQDNFDPMSLPDPPSYSKSPVPRENDENRTNGQITRTPIPDPATPIDKVDEDVDAMLSANDSLSPPPMLSPLGGGDDGTPGKRHKKKSRKGKRNKKRMSICMPSENPEISGVLATEVSGMRPLTDDDQEAGAASELPKVSTEELPGLLNEAITKFCDMGESKHSTKEAAEVAEVREGHEGRGQAKRVQEGHLLNGLVRILSSLRSLLTSFPRHFATPPSPFPVCQVSLRVPPPQ